MMHRAWSSIVDVPYCFSRSYVKFQGHTGQNITDFDPNWAFPDYRPVAAFKSPRFALFHFEPLSLGNICEIFIFSRSFCVIFVKIWYSCYRNAIRNDVSLYMVNHCGQHGWATRTTPLSPCNDSQLLTCTIACGYHSDHLSSDIDHTRVGILTQSQPVWMPQTSGTE